MKKGHTVLPVFKKLKLKSHVLSPIRIDCDVVESYRKAYEHVLPPRYSECSQYSERAQAKPASRQKPQAKRESVRSVVRRVSKNSLAEDRSRSVLSHIQVKIDQVDVVSGDGLSKCTPDQEYNSDMNTGKSSEDKLRVGAHHQEEFSQQSTKMNSHREVDKESLISIRKSREIRAKRHSLAIESEQCLEPQPPKRRAPSELNMLATQSSSSDLYDTVKSNISKRHSS